MPGNLTFEQLKKAVADGGIDLKQQRRINNRETSLLHALPHAGRPGVDVAVKRVGAGDRAQLHHAHAVAGRCGRHRNEVGNGGNVVAARLRAIDERSDRSGERPAAAQTEVGTEQCARLRVDRLDHARAERVDRNERRDANKHADQAVKDGKLSDDQNKLLHEKVQNAIKDAEHRLDDVLKKKTHEIMED